MENGSVYYSSNPDGQINDALAMNEAKSGFLTEVSNPAGYFYFIKIGDIFIADRIVALGTSYNELYEAGYINGRFRSPSKEEYETILSSEEEKYNINIWHKNNNYQGYSTFYGEISSTLNSNDQIWIYGLLGVTGDWSFGGDFYHTQYASSWNSKEYRNYLYGGNGGWYMLGSYRPVIDIKNMRISVFNNLEIGE